MAADRKKVNARNRRAGAQFEIDGLTKLRSRGLDTERPRLSGKEDEGDIRIRVGESFFVHEYKNVQEATWRYGYIQDVIRQAREESKNYAAKRGIPPERTHYAAVLKTHRKKWEESVVCLPMSEYLRLIEG